MTSSMRRDRSYVPIAALAVALAGAGLTACNRADKPAVAAAPNPCAAFAPTQTPVMPMATGSTQTEIDCSAWQAFIALNWKADPNPARNGYPDPAAQWASFGTPGDISPKVWESYFEASAVFGSAPLKGQWQAKRPAMKTLSRISKLGDTDLSDVTQAGGGHHWLTSQRGEITY